ncbi:helix-turn-helix domain-containing protein [Enterococcus gallinarum]|uniref:helix-turn-helix domain-containing protein n=1 Tax=Enterococcus gallinarum TaxID=1353 RepID=UPI0024334474|nr:helix-turn-helix domain-containing protein [Enterococcus gallinarum]
MDNMLKDIRIKKKISRKKLALLVGCDERTIEEIEKYKIYPSKEIMLTIAGSLGEPPENIFNLSF